MHDIFLAALFSFIKAPTVQGLFAQAMRGILLSLEHLGVTIPRTIIRRRALHDRESTKTPAGSVPLYGVR